MLAADSVAEMVVETAVVLVSHLAVDSVGDWVAVSAVDSVAD